MDKKILNSHYNILEYKLLPGNDRIDKEKFAEIKDDVFDNVVKKFNKGNYKFTSYKKVSTKSGREVYIATIRDRIVLNVLKDHIQYKYDINYKNRQDEIKKLVTILQDNIPLTLIRTDIKDFFNSINKSLLFSKLNESSLLGSKEYLLLSKSLKKLKSGVGQGLPISNALAEIYMENLDWELKRITQNVAYYSRYVDDIIIVLNGKMTDSEITNVNNKLEELLKKNRLTKNTDKSFIRRLDSNEEFSFLGYKFLRKESSEGKNNDFTLDIDISQSKYNKECKKIERVFKDFKSKGNFEVLQERLRILTSRNIIIKRTKRLTETGEQQVDKKIYFGLIENYKQINSYNTLRNLDRYLAKNILTYISDKKKRSQLFQYSYERNFKKKRVNDYTRYTKDEYITMMYEQGVGLTYEEDVEIDQFASWFEIYDTVEMQQTYLKEILSVIRE